MYNETVSIDDVVKFLFEAKKDKHAQRVMRMAEQLKMMEGQLEIMWHDRNTISPPTNN